MRQTLCSLIVLGACGGGTAAPTTTPQSVDPRLTTVTSGSSDQRPHAVEPDGPTGAPPREPDTSSLLAAEMAAFERARPVFEKWCAACHSKDGRKQSVSKRKHFDMTTYPFGGHHASEIGAEVREALGVTGKKPTMPADNKGAVKGEELEVIKAWADAFDAAHAAGAHAGRGPDSDHKH
jgi:hypothetical protein